MKKTFRKVVTPRRLVLRGQILRVLADVDLTRAAGGLDSNNAPCPAVPNTGRIACPTWPG
jgi:hypothetical protein